MPVCTCSVPGTLPRAVAGGERGLAPTQECAHELKGCRAQSRERLLPAERPWKASWRWWSSSWALRLGEFTPGEAGRAFHRREALSLGAKEGMCRDKWEKQPRTLVGDMVLM